MMKSGNDRYHQIHRVVEYPPQARRELSPNKEADGVLGMMKAIGSSNFNQESSLNTWRVNYLCSHSLGDKIELVMVIHHSCRSFQNKIQFPGNLRMTTKEITMMDISNDITKFRRAD